MMTSTLPPLGDWLDAAPWRDRKVSLLRIPSDPAEGIEQAHTLTDKRALLGRSGGTVLALWTGQWRTDARMVTPDDLAALGRMLG